MMKTGKRGEKVLTQIKKLPTPYDAMGERLHELILRNAPELEPTWRWGLAFYTKDGKDICYFKKLKNETCMTFGFGDAAKLSPTGRPLSSCHAHGASPRWTTRPRRGYPL